MALLKIYSIRDNKTSAYLRPQTNNHEVEVKRDLQIVVNNMKDSQVFHYPQDYDLYQLGEFNQETGQIIPFTAPVFICSAVSLKNTAANTISELREALTPPNETEESYHGQ